MGLDTVERNDATSPKCGPIETEAVCLESLVAGGAIPTYGLGGCGLAGSRNRDSNPCKAALAEIGLHGIDAFEANCFQGARLDGDGCPSDEVWAELERIA